MPKLDGVPHELLSKVPESTRQRVLETSRMLGLLSQWNKSDVQEWSHEDLVVICSADCQSAADAEVVPSLPTNPVTRYGDLWVMGRHRLLCGDSTKADDVKRLLDGARPNLMVTDPPYGVEYDADWRNQAFRSDGSPSNGRAIGAVSNDHEMCWDESWRLAPCKVAYIWHAGRHASRVQASIEASGFMIRCQLIWAKSNFAIGRGNYHWQHEPCWYAVRDGESGGWIGDHSQTTLWSIPKAQKNETGHSTQKPVECMARPIRNHAGDVYDPFVGSGTTVVACEQLGRRCYAIDIDPVYVDVAVRRWCKLTGQDAIREGDGAKFGELLAAREGL